MSDEIKDWVLVPAKFGIPADAWESAQFAFGGPGTGEGEAYIDCTAWIGEIENDDGSKTHGLHLSCDECPEEGCITLAEFAAAPTPPAEAQGVGGGGGSDDEIDAKLDAIYRQMRASGEHNGGMVGVAWSRAVYRAALSAQPRQAGESAPEVHSYDPTERRESVTIRWEDGACLSYVLDHTRYTNNLPASAPVGVEGLMQLAREWCLSWGEWAHDNDPDCKKENAAEAALRAALTAALAQQPAAVDEAFRKEVERIADDYHPGHLAEAPMALQEMRDALTAALAQPQGEG